MPYFKYSSLQGEDDPVRKDTGGGDAGQVHKAVDVEPSAKVTEDGKDQSSSLFTGKKRPICPTAAQLVMLVSEKEANNNSPLPAAVGFKTDKLESQLFYYLSDAYCDYEKINDYKPDEKMFDNDNTFPMFIWNGVRIAAMMYIETVVSFEEIESDGSGWPKIDEPDNMWHTIAYEQIERVFSVPKKPTWEEGMMWAKYYRTREAFFGVYTFSKLAEFIVDITRPIPLGRTLDHPGASVGKAIANLAGMLLFATLDPKDMTDKNYLDWIKGDIATGSSTHHPHATTIAFHHAERGALTEDFVAHHQKDMWDLFRTILNYITTKAALQDATAFLSNAALLQAFDAKSEPLQKKCDEPGFKQFSKIPGLDQCTINALPALSYAPTSFAIILTETCILFVTLWKDVTPLADGFCPIIRRHVKRFPIYTMNPHRNKTTHTNGNDLQNDPTPTAFLHHEGDKEEMFLLRHLITCSNMWKRVDSEVRKYTLSIFQCVENLTKGLKRYTEKDNRARLASNYAVAHERIAPSYYKRGQFNSTTLAYNLTPIPADDNERKEWFRSVERRKGSLSGFGNTTGLMNLDDNKQRDNILISSNALPVTAKVLEQFGKSPGWQTRIFSYEMRESEPIVTAEMRKRQASLYYVAHNAPDCGGRPPTRYLTEKEAEEDELLRERAEALKKEIETLKMRVKTRKLVNRIRDDKSPPLPEAQDVEKDTQRQSAPITESSSESERPLPKMNPLQGTPYGAVGGGDTTVSTEFVEGPAPQATPASAVREADTTTATEFALPPPLRADSRQGGNTQRARKRGSGGLVATPREEFDVLELHSGGGGDLGRGSGHLVGDQYEEEVDSIGARQEEEDDEIERDVDHRLQLLQQDSTYVEKCVASQRRRKAAFQEHGDSWATGNTPNKEMANKIAANMSTPVRELNVGEDIVFTAKRRALLKECLYSGGLVSGHKSFLDSGNAYVRDIVFCGSTVGLQEPDTVLFSSDNADVCVIADSFFLTSHRSPLYTDPKSRYLFDACTFGLVENGSQRKFITNCYAVLHVVQYYFHTPLEIANEMKQILEGKRSQEQVLAFFGREVLYPFYPNPMVLQFVRAMLRFVESQESERSAARARKLGSFDTNDVKAIVDFFTESAEVIFPEFPVLQNNEYIKEVWDVDEKRNVVQFHYTAELVLKIVANFDRSGFKAKARARSLLKNASTATLEDIFYCLKFCNECRWSDFDPGEKLVGKIVKKAFEKVHAELTTDWG